jgi:NAD(P)-dependent dehydrogenase (short-subunit alcohol dehydrogenase family)
MMPVQMDLQLRDLRVLVTGGSAGIGLATAELLIAEGARVAIASRSPQREAGRIGAAAVAADLATAGGCTTAVAEAAAALGGLDALVNNVGVARIGTLEQIEDARWQAAWDTNVMSYLRCIRAALPHLRDSEHAAIVNVSSTSGKRPSAGMPEYSVTKAAVLSLSRLVADARADALAGLAGARRPGRPDRRRVRPGPRAGAGVGGRGPAAEAHG